MALRPALCDRIEDTAAALDRGPNALASAADSRADSKPTAEPLHRRRRPAEGARCLGFDLALEGWRCPVVSIAGRPGRQATVDQFELK
jgi:hypothetical protein